MSNLPDVSRVAALVPWAWGINGCASVLSAVLAILLAMSLRFNAVVVIAIALYVVAAATASLEPKGTSASESVNVPRRGLIQSCR